MSFGAKQEIRYSTKGKTPTGSAPWTGLSVTEVITAGRVRRNGPLFAGSQAIEQMSFQSNKRSLDKKRLMHYK